MAYYPKYLLLDTRSPVLTTKANMPLRRKHTRRYDTIVISSSSDPNEASEDSEPESDADSPSKHGGYAAENDMSERQTRKINSGNYGMFNHPTLMFRPPSTPDSSKKRKRVKEYSSHKKFPPRKSLAKKERDTPELVDMTDQNEDGQSLFIPEDSPEPNEGAAGDEAQNEEDLYTNMTPERARKVKQYLSTLELVRAVDANLQAAETELSEVTTEQTSLSEKFAIIDATAEDKIADIKHERDEAIRIANEVADSRIQKVQEQLPLKKASYEDRIRDCDERKMTTEERVMEARTEVITARAAKAELERQGGFELCSDVRDVQAQRR